jgi:hypothetical protein
MWNAKIAEKKFDRGQLKVIVAFDNGVESFTEVYNVTNNQSLDSNIKSKLRQLEDVDKLDVELEIGAFKPIAEIIKPTVEPVVEEII